MIVLSELELYGAEITSIGESIANLYVLYDIN